MGGDSNFLGGASFSGSGDPLLDNIQCSGTDGCNCPAPDPGYTLESWEGCEDGGCLCLCHYDSEMAGYVYVATCTGMSLYPPGSIY